MTGKLPINIDDLLKQRTIEGERIEYKAGWNPMSVLHTICAFANDFHNLGGGYIVLGVEERKGRPLLPPKGLDPEQINAVQKELLELGHSAIQPHYHPISGIYNIEGRTILVLGRQAAKPVHTRPELIWRKERHRNGLGSSANTAVLSAPEVQMSVSCSPWLPPCRLMTGIIKRHHLTICLINSFNNSSGYRQ